MSVISVSVAEWPNTRKPGIFVLKQVFIVSKILASLNLVVPRQKRFKQFNSQLRILKCNLIYRISWLTMKLNKHVSSDRSKSRKRHFSAPSHIRYVLGFHRKKAKKDTENLEYPPIPSSLIVIIKWSFHPFLILVFLQASSNVCSSVQGTENQVWSQIYASEEGWWSSGDDWHKEATRYDAHTFHLHDDKHSIENINDIETPK